MGLFEKAVMHLSVNSIRGMADGVTWTVKAAKAVGIDIPNSSDGKKQGALFVGGMIGVVAATARLISPIAVIESAFRTEEDFKRDLKAIEDRTKS